MGPSRRFSNSSAEGGSATPVGPDRMALREVPLQGKRKRMIEGRADVVVDGKKYEPTTLAAKTGLLTLGDTTRGSSKMSTEPPTTLLKSTSSCSLTKRLGSCSSRDKPSDISSRPIPQLTFAISLKDLPNFAWPRPAPQAASSGRHYRS